MKEMPPSKILQGKCVEQGVSFHGRDSHLDETHLDEVRGLI